MSGEDGILQRIKDAVQLLMHMGSFFILFAVVITLFFLKEQYFVKKNGPQSVVSPTRTPIEMVPPASDGVRILMDQANSEFATTEATLGKDAIASDEAILSMLSLENPLTCVSAAEKPNTFNELYVDKGKVRGKLWDDGQAHNVLLTDTCLYEWKGNVGTKDCDVADTIGLVKQMISMGTISIGDLIAQSIPSAKEATMSALLNSCESISPSESVFVPPSTVRFGE